MPLPNSYFRIVHRRPEDPHGVEGYFIHELYVREDRTVTGWRAGVSIGHLQIDGLKEHMISVIDAFNHEPIEHRDLSTAGFKIPDDAGLDPPIKHLLLEQRRVKGIDHGLFGRISPPEEPDAPGGQRGSP